MSWIERCYQTYENNITEVGVPSVNCLGRELPVLLPVGHTSQKVHVEISLTKEGKFLFARILRTDEMTTIIPCTEESSARTSGPVPHPLVDKLQYIAGDYGKYGGSKKMMWAEYLKQLRDWCNSPYGLPQVRAVLFYLEKGCLIEDLIEDGILFIGSDGKLVKKWTGAKEETPLIFQTITGGDQTEAFVRFNVDGKALSNDTMVWNSFIQYYLSILKREGFCYVQGRKMLLSQLSPYKIRNPGDRAKLISSNDGTNFTYRGRFNDAEEALSIGYETTQKAHSALRWLIGRQGISIGDQTILVWGMADEQVPSVTEDTYGLVKDMEEDDPYLDGPEDISEFDKPIADTRAAFALRFNNAIQGYREKLTDYSQITVMILDSATPGRMSIRYYRELSGSRLMDAVEDWHRNFAWEQCYRKEQKEKKGKSVSESIVLFGAPAPKDIAEATYGVNVDSKLKQHTIERLLPCITEQRPFPRDLIRTLMYRAANGIAMEPWEAKKTRGIACALVRGYYHRNKKEDFSMALDENCHDRSYLFGRILACADQLERTYNYYFSGDVHRPTNALRMETIFTQRPAKTTDRLRKKLEPYLERLLKNNKSIYSNDLMLKLLDRIPIKEFNNDPLSELYLLGYASQRAEFFKKPNIDRSIDANNE